MAKTATLKHLRSAAKSQTAIDKHHVVALGF
jgi:hypothetical protein